jgi:hypothetical protein
MSGYQPYIPAGSGQGYTPATSPYAEPYGEPSHVDLAAGYGQAPLAAQPYPGLPYPSAMVVGAPIQHPMATTVLVLGILGFVTSGITGIIAWVLGNRAARDCATGLYTMSDPLRIGRILGMITALLLFIGIGVVLLSAVPFAIFAISALR